jgi:hypothetical protein
VVVAVLDPMTTRPAASKNTVTVSISRRRTPVESLIKAMSIFACPSAVRARETVRLRAASLAITPDATPCRRKPSSIGSGRHVAMAVLIGARSGNRPMRASWALADAVATATAMRRATVVPVSIEPAELSFIESGCEA